MKIRYWLIALATVLTAIAPVTMSAEAILYSAPESVVRSSDFSVSVDDKEAFVFFSGENEIGKKYLPGADSEFRGEKKVIVRNEVHDLGKMVIRKARESWISFTTDKSARIHIAQLGDAQPLEQALLIDERGNAINHAIADGALSFTAWAGHKYLLFLNNNLSRRLTVFAEHPETDVPDMNGANTFLIHPGTPREAYENTEKKTLYFLPGMHEMGDGFPLSPGLQIYLAPGSYVRGFFTCPPDADTAGASGVKIFGRGILSSEYNQKTDGPNYNFLPRPISFWSNSIYLGGFNREPAENQVVKDITIIYPTQQPIMGNGINTLIENVKVINYEKGFGGICVGSNSKVMDCYVSSDTRVLTAFGSDTTFTRNLIVGFESDTPFYFGDRILDDLRNITVEDSTVVGDWKNLAAIHQVHFGNLSNFKVKNIKAIYPGKKSNVSLLSLGVGFSPYRRGQYIGNLTNVEVSDISLTVLNGSPLVSVSAFGFSEQAAVRDVMVKHVTVNGQAAKFIPHIQQCAYNVTLGDTTIAEGTRPVAKARGLEYPQLLPVKNPLEAYPRRDEDGDKYGRRIAHQVAFPDAEQKADPSFPKSLSSAFGNGATGASLEGIKTVSAPKRDFLQTYAAIDDPRMYTLHSPDYEVIVGQKSSGSPPAKVTVYENIGTLMNTGNRLVNPPPMLTEHFANFTHRGPVEVTVKMKDRAPAIKDAIIMPSQLDIEPIYAADRRSFSFSVPGPQYLVIIVNGDWLRPLFVFSNPPETPVPDPSDPAVLMVQTTDDFKTLEKRRKLADYRVVYFAPGYHDIGAFFPVFSNQTIYIPGDAYVVGTILGLNRDKADNNDYGTKRITYNKEIFQFPAFTRGYDSADDYVYVPRSDRDIRDFLGTIKNFTIRGRGILSAEKMDWYKGQETVPSYIIFVDRGGKNGVLEGLTFTGRHFHSANFFGSPALLSNVKTLYGFHGNTDASQWGMVRRNLFSIEQDDGTYIKNGLDIDGWFAWQQNNANTFCFTRSMPSNGNTLGHSLVRNVTVIDGRYGESAVGNLAESHYNPMRGGFWLGINHDRSSHNFGYVADIVMQDIYFETIVNPLFQFAPMTGTHHNKMIGVEDLTFDNISVPMGQNWKSIFGIREKAPDDFFRNIVIKDLMIGGKKMMKFEDFARARSEGQNLDVILK